MQIGLCTPPNPPPPPLLRTAVETCGQRKFYRRVEHSVEHGTKQMQGCCIIHYTIARSLTSLISFLPSSQGVFYHREAFGMVLLDTCFLFEVLDCISQRLYICSRWEDFNLGILLFMLSSCLPSVFSLQCQRKFFCAQLSSRHCLGHSWHSFWNWKLPFSLWFWADEVNMTNPWLDPLWCRKRLYFH